MGAPASSTAAAAGPGTAALPGLGEALPHLEQAGCIYLDYNATTPIFPEASEQVQAPRWAQHFHHCRGRRCHRLAPRQGAAYLARCPSQKPRLSFPHCSSPPPFCCPWQVAAEMLPFLTAFGNPSSGHAYGRPCKAAVDLARRRVAAMVGAAPEELVFTSCGSESDNW
jgi:selenocysteine lyase/cysteine desulfurase